MTLTATLRGAFRFGRRRPSAIDAVRPGGQPSLAQPVSIGEGDALLAYLQTAPGPVDIDSIELDSPAVAALRAEGVKLVVPLVSSGELIGTINLGPRRSDQEYSTDDRRLLDTLATQAAPALRVAQLVRQQEAAARERQRIEQELQVAQLIQQNFLPTELPRPEGWAVDAYYHPAREVGGDFYDVAIRPDGQIAFVVGDVTDKGVPAAMVMAATRSLLRAAGGRLATPGQVLGRVNDLLQPDIPARMFVTCLFGVLDPTSGRVRFANAGHNLPFLRSASGDVRELRATGMPLGLMPGMTYEEHEARMEPGDELLLHSDGIAESHGPDRSMFGIPRLRDVMAAPSEDGVGPIERVLGELASFTGAGWEQEDDITLLSFRWSPAASSVGPTELLGEFDVPSETGREREAMALVDAAVAELGLDLARRQRLGTGVGEATMNAIEHGNGNDPSKLVHVRVTANRAEVIVAITDEGGDDPIRITETPDLEAKLRGEQTTRGWGVFLIQNMVDSVRVSTGGGRHTLELVLSRASEGARGKEDAHV